MTRDEALKRAATTLDLTGITANQRVRNDVADLILSVERETAEKCAEIAGEAFFGEEEYDIRTAFNLRRCGEVEAK